MVVSKVWSPSLGKYFSRDLYKKGSKVRWGKENSVDGYVNNGSISRCGGDPFIVCMCIKSSGCVL